MKKMNTGLYGRHCEGPQGPWQTSRQSCAAGVGQSHIRGLLTMRLLRLRLAILPLVLIGAGPVWAQGRFENLHRVTQLLENPQLQLAAPVEIAKTDSKEPDKTKKQPPWMGKKNWQDEMRLKLMVSYYANRSAYSALIVRANPIQCFDASFGDNICYPVIVGHIVSPGFLPVKAFHILYGMYVINQNELRMIDGNPRAGLDLLDKNRLIGFAMDGAPYLYLQSLEPEDQRKLPCEASQNQSPKCQYVEWINRIVAEKEMEVVWFQRGPDWSRAKDQLAWVLPQVLHQHGVDGEMQPPIKVPWWIKEGLSQEAVEAMLSEYKIQEMIDLDNDGADEFFRYQAKAESLDQREELHGKNNRAADPTNKWNSLVLGYEVRDSHKSYAYEHIPVGGKEYCSRNAVWDWVDKPYTDGFLGSVFFLKDIEPEALKSVLAPESASYVKSALLFFRENGSSKAVFVYGVSAGAPYFSVVTETKELDFQTSSYLKENSRAIALSRQDNVIRTYKSETSIPLGEDTVVTIHATKDNGGGVKLQDLLFNHQGRQFTIFPALWKIAN